MQKKVAFVVLTCDNYADLWPMYLHFFNKNWPDCPFDKYFVTNFKDCPDPLFSSIKIGRDDSWSDGLLKSIDYLKNKYQYILLTLEDWPIIEKVNQEKFNKYLTSFFQANGNYISFRNQPKATRNFNEMYGIIDKGSLYRPTCVYSLWNVEVLKDLLVREENAWQFEKNGSIRSDKYDNFFVVYDNFFTICNTIIKGKWVRSEIKRIKKLGFEPNTIDRESFSILEGLFSKFYISIFRILNRHIPIPWKFRRNIIKKIKQ